MFLHSHKDVITKIQRKCKLELANFVKIRVSLPMVTANLATLSKANA